MMKKIKDVACACGTFYQKCSNIIYWFSFTCIIVLVVAIGFIITQKEEEKEQRLSELRTFSVTQDALDKTPLYTRLEQSGIEKVEILNIVKKLDEIMHTRKLRPQDSFMVSFNEDNQFALLVVTRDLSRYFVAKVKGELVAGIIDIEILSRQKEASGEIQSSLYASMVSKGMIVPLIIAFTDVFSWNIDFYNDTRNGDSYSVIWEEDYTLNGMIVDQRIIAAKYLGSFVGTSYAFNFEDDFYDENGKVTKRLFLKSPISFKGARITSRFNPKRMHPILRIVRPHNGIDYAAPVGTPVEAIADGTIKFVGVRGGYGNFIEITHANGFSTGYGHLKGFNVKKGEKVKQGKVVGYVGSSGLSTGPHLDFSIKEKGKFVDFLGLKNRNSAIREIPKEKMEEFNKIRDKYKEILDKKPEAATPAQEESV
ncbi:murein DD-endopeptidase MepM/ murein hydrolase activator NlpD [Elusimicrobium posterum]|uniref:M23 family metallopeptidase n=1 Tax=Elusimicrobium posterum TaxID=3116653 RepID=UPI003C77209C